MKRVEVAGDAREASGLVAVTSPVLLDAHGWDQAYWTALDEGPVEQAIVLIGHGAAGWELDRPSFPRQPDRTADAEALARFGNHVYVFGSHFGGRDGIDRKRAFAARFSEDDLVGSLEVWRDDFEWHRAVNDALAGISLLKIKDRARENFIERAVDRGGGRIRRGDWPINVEGAAFKPNGTLLLGLRCPASRAKHPIVVEIPGYPDAFGEPLPPVSGVWELRDVLAPAVVGIRDLEAEDAETFSLIAGGLDAEVLRDRDRGNAGFVHWRATIPPGTAERVRSLPDGVKRVEGLARSPKGGYVYLCDDETGIVLYVD